MLSIGPWTWPQHGEPLARARAIVPEGPPALLPGQALLVTVSPTTASLWVLGSSDVPCGEAVAFGRRARAAWTTAASTLPRSVPVLWTSVQPLERMAIEAHWLVSLTEPGALESRETVIDGSSFGLSFLLAMASILFDRPLPVDVAASAEIDASGAVLGVDAIARKVRVLRMRAPRVHTMLVAADQAVEAEQAAQGAIEIVAVRTAAEALDRVFAGELSTLLTQAGRDPARRSELVRSFFQLAIAGRAAMVDWTPVAEAARLASEHWKDLEPDQREEMSFARMVASRHEGTDVRARLPDRRWLGSLPAPLRLDVLAHVVQQSADTAEPPAQDAIELADPYVVRGSGAFVQHLRLLGALGRLAAFTGGLQDALAVQAEAARGFLDRMAAIELSYPLSEWFRLAGALRDPEAFRQADEMRLRATLLDAPDTVGSPYVSLARCRAGVLLDHAPDAIAEQLESLCADLALPSHVRGSATRWLVRLCDRSGTRTSAAGMESGLRTRATGPGRDARLASRYVDLIDLDRAVRSADAEHAAQVVSRMQAREPGLVRNLMSRAPEGSARFKWLATVYPY